MKSLVVLVGLLLGTTAYAEEVRQFSQCQLVAGKTMADLSAALDDWAAAIKKDKIAYNVDILVGQAASGEKANTFWLAERSPSLSSYAQAYEWWYANASAAPVAKKFDATFTCEGGSLYRVTMSR